MAPNACASVRHRSAAICAATAPREAARRSRRAATQVVMNEFLRGRNEQLLDFVNRGIRGEDEAWEDGTLISTATARLTPAQSKDLTAKIIAVIDEAVDTYRNQVGDDVRPVTIRADVFPLPNLGEKS